MSYSYDTRKKPAGKAGVANTAAPPEAVQTNLTPMATDKGNRVDLPDAMRAKMENAFGADLGAVKLYESQAVAAAGARQVELPAGARSPSRRGSSTWRAPAARPCWATSSATS